MTGYKLLSVTLLTQDQKPSCSGDSAWLLHMAVTDMTVRSYHAVGQEHDRVQAVVGDSTDPEPETFLQRELQMAVTMAVTDGSYV